MKGLGWYFPVLRGGGVEGCTSNDIEAFKGDDLYANLAREICQNSLDAKDPNEPEPLVVKFDLRSFNPSEYEFFKQYRECLNGCERFWTETSDGMPDRLRELLDEAQGALDAGNVEALVIGDYNTPGLKGGAKMPPSGAFKSLIYAPGTSYKESDTSAGSYGIGRNAPFACSALSCVCYRTLAIDGTNAFSAISKLATLYNSEGKATLSQGRYQYNDDDREIWRPITPDDNDAFADEFNRTEYGTDVVVLGFKMSNDWKTRLERAVLENFYMAIQQDALIVYIQGKRIDSNTIAACFEELMETEDPKTERAFQFYETLNDESCTRIKLSIIENDDASLVIRTDPSVGMMKDVALFRSSGMQIDHYPPRGIFHPYAAVFNAEGETLRKLLRSTEPARHNSWDPGRAKSENATKARAVIRRIRSEIKRCLKEECKILAVDSMDAVGAAEYLPDDLGDGSQDGGGKDILKPLIKLRKSKVVKPAKQTEDIKAKKGTGTGIEGDVHNKRKHPKDDEDLKIPKVVDPDGGKDEGIIPGAGGKVITRVVKSRKRAWPLSAKAGLYRLRIIPGEDADAVYVHCSAVGENGTSGKLQIETAMRNGQHLAVAQDGSVGPLSVKDGQMEEIVITFAEKEKMALDVQLKTAGGE